MSRSRLSRPYLAPLLALVATLFAFAIKDVIQPLDFRLYDMGMAARTPKTPPDITILGIDEAFMEGRHAYLAPRDRLAKLISIASQGHPRAIAVDVWLDSRIDNGPNGVDAQLRKALLEAKKRGVPVILSDIPPDETEFSGSQNGQTARSSTIPFFKEVATGAASVLFDPDVDGKLRRYQVGDDENFLPLRMAQLGGAKIDTSRLRRPVPIDFAGPPKTVTTQSAQDLLQTPIMAALLQGHLVFIGTTYPGSRDYFPSPFSFDPKVPPMYGVELLAQTTNSLLMGQRQRPFTTSRAYLVDFLCVFAVAWVIAFLALGGTALGLGSAILAIAAAAVCAFLSAHEVSAFWGYRFHPASPFFIAVPLAASCAIAWRSVLQARELKLVRDTFGAYVGKEVLEALGGKMPELGGETRPIAVLFCDIRGFSGMAEAMADDPKALLDELNGHFAPLVAALQNRGAYVDNYVGDLVMALFGAPLSSNNLQSDTRAAVLAALDFVRLVEERNTERRAKGQIVIEVGVGVHCGIAVVGNMGASQAESEGKIHYTAIGDVVNVASRVESATRHHETALLVTKEVMETCGQGPGLPQWEWVTSTQVKGRSAPVDLYRIASNRGDSVDKSPR